MGENVVIEVAQIGKECPDGCILRQTVGDRIMPLEGVFVTVIKRGILKEGDPIRVLK